MTVPATRERAVDPSVRGSSFSYSHERPYRIASLFRATSAGDVITTRGPPDSPYPAGVPKILEYTMAGCLNRPAAADGVIAYQDYEQPNLFHYFPLRIDSVSGDTLKSFKVDYYGINATLIGSTSVMATTKVLSAVICEAPRYRTSPPRSGAISSRSSRILVGSRNPI